MTLNPLSPLHPELLVLFNYACTATTDIPLRLCGMQMCSKQAFMIQEGQTSAATVTVTSEMAVLLTVPLTTIQEVILRSKPLGDPTMDPAAAQTIASALKRSAPGTFKSANCLETCCP